MDKIMGVKSKRGCTKCAILHQQERKPKRGGMRNHSTFPLVTMCLKPKEVDHAEGESRGYSAGEPIHVEALLLAVAYKHEAKLKKKQGKIHLQVSG